MVCQFINIFPIKTSYQSDLKNGVTLETFLALYMSINQKRHGVIDFERIGIFTKDKEIVANKTGYNFGTLHDVRLF